MGYEINEDFSELTDTVTQIAQQTQFRGIGPEEAYQKLVAGIVNVKQIMDKKAEKGVKDEFIKQMKGLNAFDEFIEALLVKCNKADVIQGWTDVTEPDKDKLI